MAAAVFLTRLIAGMLFDISSTDPWTFAAITVTLIATTLMATLTPARRASRSDGRASR